VPCRNSVFSRISCFIANRLYSTSEQELQCRHADILNRVAMAQLRSRLATDYDSLPCSLVHRRPFSILDRGTELIRPNMKTREEHIQVQEWDSHRRECFLSLAKLGIDVRTYVQSHTKRQLETHHNLSHHRKEVGETAVTEDTVPIATPSPMSISNPNVVYCIARICPATPKLVGNIIKKTTQQTRV